MSASLRTAASTTPPPSGRSMGGVYQPQLDGLRAVAITGVLFHHFGMHIPDFLEYGPISVRLFFALTGYFITLWLWKAEDTANAGGVSVWRELPVFHGRRLLRIVPPLYLSLLLAAVLGVGAVRSDFLWHVAFLSNFYAAKTGYWPDAMAHLWSLSVQEQFYLLWPVVLLLTPRRWFPGVLAGAVTIAFGFRLACIVWEVNPIIRWTMLFGSLDSFATGGFVAWLAGGKVGVQVMTERQRWGWGAFAFACLLMARSLRYMPQTNEWIATIELLEAVFIGWVILATAQGWRGPIGWFLSLPPLVYMGKISLGIYLFHVLVHIVFGPMLDRAGIDPVQDNTVRVLLLTALSIGAAALSWHLFEQPLARLKPALVGHPKSRGA
ncbi:MAG: acyltransferase [Chthoniobacterales bacterium]|nr:acyltransferase [Chthoniobacterales bacterium]